MEHLDVVASHSDNQLSMSKDGKLFAFSHSTYPSVYVYERKPCHSSCATCSGPEEYDCLTCISGVPDFGVCYDKCAIPCSLCGVGSINDCLLCDESTVPPTSYLLEQSPTTCVVCNETSQMKSGNKCIQCDVNCLTCQPLNSSYCLSCLPGFSLMSTKSCEAMVCPSG